VGWVWFLAKHHFLIPHSAWAVISCIYPKSPTRTLSRRPGLTVTHYTQHPFAYLHDIPNVLNQIPHIVPGALRRPRQRSSSPSSALFVALISALRRSSSPSSALFVAFVSALRRPRQRSSSPSSALFVAFVSALRRPRQRSSSPSSALFLVPSISTTVLSMPSALVRSASSEFVRPDGDVKHPAAAPSRRRLPRLLPTSMKLLPLPPLPRPLLHPRRPHPNPHPSQLLLLPNRIHHQVEVEVEPTMVESQRSSSRTAKRAPAVKVTQTVISSAQ
jgi:hypothetical protein